jgi:hypothetical protein
MHTTKHPTIESRLVPKRAVANPAECQKRPGRVYVLNLSYDPQQKGAAQGEVKITFVASAQFALVPKGRMNQNRL